MPKWNGGVIGVANNPTISSAKGIWSLSEATKAIRAGLWPPSNAGADPYFENVTMLLSADGTNGAQNNTFLDSSTNNFTITRNGNTTQGTFTPFSKPDGRWSMYQSDSASNYINFTASAGTLFQFTGNYTIEMWLYLTSISGDGSLYVVSDNSNYHAFNIDATNYNIWLNSGSATSSFSHGLALNQWNHVAMVRNGSTITVYTNGTSRGTIANSSTNGYSSPAIARNGGGAAHVGYINGYRVVKGTAVYTAAFTPPTAPLTAISGTSLLTGQNNRFIDNSSNALAITLSGTPSIQTFSPFPTLTAYASGTNGGSGYFDTTGDFLSVTGSSATNFNGVDWTIECWFFKVTLSGGNDSIIQSTTGTNSWVPYLALSTNNDRTIGVSLNAVNYSSTQTYNLNAWNHVAVVRSGGVIKVYLNGAATSISVTADITNSNLSFWIGKVDNAPGGGGYLYYFNGYISDLRVLKGTAQYTSAFTPPTAPLTAITNTSLLCNFTNGGIIDAAMSNDLETVDGASISTTQSKFGGSSMYFDGSGDKLLIPDSQNFNFGSGDFTVECWVYPTANASYAGVFTKRSSGAVYAPVQVLINSGTMALFASTSGSAWAINTNASSSPSLNTWSHIAVARNGSTMTLYLNGTSVASGSVSTSALMTNTAQFVLGAEGATDTGNYAGYIDDFRITKGYARYTANFTAPAAPFVTFGD